MRAAWSIGPGRGRRRFVKPAIAPSPSRAVLLTIWAVTSRAMIVSPESRSQTRRRPRPGRRGAPRACRHWRRAAMEMQRKAGNRVTASFLLSRGQAKLTVGSADDRYEHEADAAASEVVSRLRSARAARQVSAPLEEEGDVEHAAPALGRVQRKRSAVIGREGGDLDEATETVIKSARHSGRPLPAGQRRSMEGAFEADFGRVKLHSGPESHALNEQVGAIAFTVGSDIFLGRSAPDVANASSEALLAHELAHTVQQGGAPRLPPRDEPTSSL